MRLSHAILLAATLTVTPAISAQQAVPATHIEGPPPQTRPAGPSQRPNGAVRISGAVMAGQLLHRVDPIYPDTDAQGAVVLHAIIGPDGTVQQLAVVSGPQLLEDAALTAVRQWTYQPYLLNGNPVTVDTIVVVNFRR